MSKLLKIKTLCSLGVLNVLRVGWYRVSVVIGLNPITRLQATAPEGIFFEKPSIELTLVARKGWIEWVEAFGVKCSKSTDQPPVWNQSIISGHSTPLDIEWFRISDFQSGVGDIKGVWELSRMDWVIALSQNAITGNQQALDRLNSWLSNWVVANVPFRGANWKCGQEASIRVMHLAVSAYILRQVVNSQPCMLELVRLHLSRIAPTVTYAIGQDNNHGTSEAAALFIGGTWLAHNGISEGHHYARAGRRWLENRARRLIMPDGTFSQYSVNYHRLMLDTYCWAEQWRRVVGEPVFSEKLYMRLSKASAWLGNMVFSQTGDAPNLGANDGARLLPMSDTDFRDYRSSVQLASVLFRGSCAYEQQGDYNLSLKWLDVNLPDLVEPVEATKEYEDGGFVVLRVGQCKVAMHYPVFRFRPSQCDLLHVDFWVGDINLLRDAGSYSYNSGDGLGDYFSSVVAHNTVQFDDRDQMPKLGRFLYGAWPHYNRKRLICSEGGVLKFGVGYRDWMGAVHNRAVWLSAERLVVEDDVSEFRKSAVLRWRLAPAKWFLSSGRAWSILGSIEISASVPIQDMRIVEGWESRYYSQKTPVPVLEVVVSENCKIKSDIVFGS